jgi:hypothetical protein
MKTEAEQLKQLQERLDQLSAEIEENFLSSFWKGGKDFATGLWKSIKDPGASKTVGRATRSKKAQPAVPASNVYGVQTPAKPAKPGVKKGDITNKPLATGAKVGSVVAGRPAALGAGALGAYYLMKDKDQQPKTTSNDTDTTPRPKKPGTGATGDQEEQPMINPAIPDIPTVADNDEQEKPSAQYARNEPTVTTPTVTPTPEPVIKKELEKAKEPEDFKFSPEQEKWLGGASRKDPYIMGKMPPELGPKPTLPKPDTEKELFRTLDPTHPRYMEDFSRLENQLHEELSRITELAGLKKN